MSPITAAVVVTALSTAVFTGTLFATHYAFEALCHAVRQADRKRHRPYAAPRSTHGR
jgi:hypothetical protein